MKKIIHLILCFFVIQGIIEPLQAQSDKFKERVIATIPESYKTITFVYVAPDGDTFVYAGQKDDGIAVSYCGKEIVTGLENEIEQASEKSNSSNSILLFGSWDNEKYVIIFNDKVHKTQANKWGNRLESIDVSPNGQHMAYLAKENNKQNLYVDGKLITTRAQYLGSSISWAKALRINNDGLWAITARKQNKDYILTWDHEYGPYEGVGNPVFSSDGKHPSSRAIASRG